MHPAIGEIELGDVIAEFADVRWQSEAQFVVRQIHFDALRLQSNELEWELTCGWISKKIRERRTRVASVCLSGNYLAHL